MGPKVSTQDFVSTYSHFSQIILCQLCLPSFLSSTYSYPLEFNFHILISSILMQANKNKDIYTFKTISKK